MKTYEIECETDVEKRWFEVEGANKDEAILILYANVPDIEEIIYIREVSE